MPNECTHGKLRCLGTHRYDEATRLMTVGRWLYALVNGTPVTAVMAFVGLAMIVGGYRLRWLPRPEHAA